MADRTCTHDGCDQPRLARGLCGRHYRHARYHGTLPERPTPTTPHAVVLDVAASYHVSVVDLLHDTDGAVHPALVAAVQALRDLDHSWAEIGHILGGRPRQRVRYLALRRGTAPPAGAPADLPTTCCVGGCDHDVKFARAQLCAGHYMRWRRTGRLDPDRPLRPVCTGDGPVLDLEVHDRTGYRNGCRCEVCRADAVRMVKRNRHRPQSVPVEQGAAAVRRLTDRGMTVAAVARASGVNRQTLDRWLHGRGIPRRPTVAKVLAVPLPAKSCEDCGEEALADGRWCLPCLREHSRRDQWRATA